MGVSAFTYQEHQLLFFRSVCFLFSELNLYLYYNIIMMALMKIRLVSCLKAISLSEDIVQSKCIHFSLSS